MNFEEIADNLLFTKNDFKKNYDIAQNYYAFLTDITDVSYDSENPVDDEVVILKGGRAISPKSAARCVLDILRTSRFVQGLYAAIQKAQKNFAGEKIEILYAGCGPFATLALPQCVKFTAHEIAFTLIDIHQCSLDTAQKVFENLGFEDYVCEFVKTDAADYQNENGKKIHIIVSETMQKNLEKEPQVAITLHLAKQLRDGGTFIPQKIEVKVCLTNTALEFDFTNEKKERILLGTILELSTRSKNISAPQIIEIPDKNVGKMCLMFLTHIKIFEDIALGDYESGISYPTLLNKVDVLNGGKLEFKYIMGEIPHFQYQYI